MKQLLRRFEEQLILRNFALATRRAYLSNVRRFYLWCQWRRGKSDYDKSQVVRQYLVHRFESGKAWQTINGDYSALKILYLEVLGRDWTLQSVPRPRKEKFLPSILSKKQVVALIDHAAIFKHLLGIDPDRCQRCGASHFVTRPLLTDRRWKINNITWNDGRAPP